MANIKKSILFLGSVHGRQSYLILAITLILTCIDLLNVFRRVVLFFRGGNKFVLRSFWNAAILGKDEMVYGLPGPEYAGLVTEEPEQYELDDPKASSPVSDRHVHYGDEVIHGDTAEWANNVNRHHREFSHSAASDRTLFGARSSHSDDFPDVDIKSPKAKDTLLRRIGQGMFATVERSIVIAAYGEAVLGVVIYTGASLF